MAKMASLHAELTTIPDDAIETCEWCGDEILICEMLEECPGSHTRRSGF